MDQPPELLKTDIRVEGPGSEFVLGVFANPATHALVIRFQEKDGEPVIKPGDYYISTSPASEQVIRLHRVSDEPWPWPRSMVHFPMRSAA